MKARGEDVHWPPNPAPHLTDWLFDIGPSVAGGMGEGPLPWTEIAEWQRSTGIELDAWEARTIRRLSRAFVAQRQAAEKPHCPAPYPVMDDDPQVVRAKVTEQFAAMFSAIQARLS